MKIEHFYSAIRCPGRLRTLAAVVSMTLLAAVITGCGGDDSGSAASAAVGSGSGTSTAPSGTFTSTGQLCTTALATAQANATTSMAATLSISGSIDGTPRPAAAGTFDAPVDHLIVKLRPASPTSLANGVRMLAARSDSTRVDGVISRVLTQWNAQRTRARVLAASVAAPALPRFDNVQLERTMSDGAAVVSLGKRVPSADATVLAQAFAADSEVAYAEPDRRLFVSTIPSDPHYSLQWNDFDPTAGVNMPAAWSLTTGSPNIVTAVIDSGYRPNIDLIDNLLPGYNFISDVNTGNNGHGRSPDATDPGDWVTLAELNDPSGPFYHCASAPNDSSWHGTQVAGLIGASANNGIGIAGASWFGKILPVRALGKCGGITSDVVDAMRWAAGVPVPGVPANRMPAKVINLSFAGHGACGSAFQSAIDDVIARGATVVVAAGNDGLANGQSLPANCAGVVAVGATDNTGKRAGFSNFGSTITLSAPGTLIVSTSNAGATTPSDDTLQYSSGTSFAAPQVAGVVALMLSRNPNLTPAQIARKLVATARPSRIVMSGPLSCTAMAPGAGLMDAGAAVASATN